MYRIIASLTLVIAASFTLGACKQGEGEVCQVDSDCEAGLKCTTRGPNSDGTPKLQHCVPETEPDPEEPDAMPPEPDAMTFDAMP
jgi:hypothetical protein